MAHWRWPSLTCLWLTLLWVSICQAISAISLTTMEPGTMVSTSWALLYALFTIVQMLARDVISYLWLTEAIPGGMFEHSYTLFMSCSCFFISVCPRHVQLRTLPSYLKCELGSSCLNVQCCMLLEKLNQSISFYLNIEDCQQRIIFGIEDLQVSRQLATFGFGELIWTGHFTNQPRDHQKVVVIAKWS